MLCLFRTIDRSGIGDGAKLSANFGPIGESGEWFAKSWGEEDGYGGYR